MVEKSLDTLLILRLIGEVPPPMQVDQLFTLGKCSPLYESVDTSIYPSRFYCAQDCRIVGHPDYFDFTMTRVYRNNTYTLMAYVSSPMNPVPSYASVSDTTIYDATIDNKNYSYILMYYMVPGYPTPNNYQFKFATIEYTPPPST